MHTVPIQNGCGNSMRKLYMNLNWVYDDDDDDDVVGCSRIAQVYAIHPFVIKNQKWQSSGAN